MIDLEFTSIFPFCGLGSGAGGILSAHIKSQGYSVKFRSLGGFDIDLAACRDFEMLTKSPAFCFDMHSMTVEGLRQLWPDGADFIFTSAPCQGGSGLIPDRIAKSAHYVSMNSLGVLFIRRALEAWSHRLPGMILFENVPRLKSRAPEVVDTLYSLLREADYLVTDHYHECGELGGLAQKRKRWLMVARHPKRVAELLHQPIKRKIRACGEVLGTLPMPSDPSAGPMHVLPGISWLNAVRLALIPAGGDWRDLPGVLAEGQTRREKFRRDKIEKWDEPAATITGPGGSGVEHIQDPRLGQSENAHWNKFKVNDWKKPSNTVIGATRPGSGAPSVSDPRPSFNGQRSVKKWSQPSRTVTSGRGDNGAYAVADPRAPDQRRDGGFNTLMVVPWHEQARTVTGEARPTTGPFSVADPRYKTGYDHAYRVLRMDEPSFTVHGKAHPGTGAYSVADPRRSDRRHPGMLHVDQAELTITEIPTPFAISDRDRAICVIRDITRGAAKKPNEGTMPVIVSRDGTWHRPMTTLELAALQSIPVRVNGKPLILSGTSHTAWRTRIGNAVPWDTAKAIGEEMLLTFLNSKIGFTMSWSNTIWVETDEDAYPVELM